MPHSPHHLNEGEINVADSPARPALVAGGPIRAFLRLEWDSPLLGRLRGVLFIWQKQAED